MFNDPTTIKFRDLPHGDSQITMISLLFNKHFKNDPQKYPTFLTIFSILVTTRQILHWTLSNELIIYLINYAKNKRF